MLAQGIRAISDLISKPGLINVDFRDIRTIMGETEQASTKLINTLIAMDEITLPKREVTSAV